VVTSTAGVLVVVIVVVLLLLGGSSRGKIAGMPSGVAAFVGPSPLIVTLQGSVLELLSQPAVDRLASLESSIARVPAVRAEYGPVAWLRAQVAQIARQVAAKTTAQVTRAALLVRYGASSGLTIDDGTLATTLAFGTQIGPLRSLHWLFPSGESARIFLRLAPGASRAGIGTRVVNFVNQSQLLGITATVR
jgi:hypothetical protein